MKQRVFGDKERVLVDGEIGTVISSPIVDGYVIRLDSGQVVERMGATIELVLESSACNYWVRENGIQRECGVRATFRGTTGKKLHYCEAHGHFISHQGPKLSIPVTRIAPADLRPLTSRLQGAPERPYGAAAADL